MTRTERRFTARRDSAKPSPTGRRVFSEWQVLPQEFIDLGERVLVRVVQVAHGKTSGVRVEEDWWFLFELTGSKVSKLSFYANPAEAREAAELSE